MRFLCFHKKVIDPLKCLKHWEFHEDDWNLVKSATFPPMSGIPSTTKRFIGLGVLFAKIHEFWRAE